MVYEEKTFEVEELGDGSYLIIVDGVKVITTTPSQEVLDHIEMVRKTGE